MKRSSSKFSKVPKYQQGGFMNVFSQGMQAGGNAVGGRQYTDEEIYNMQMYGGDMFKNQQKAEKTGAQVENVVGQMGPWGAAIAGISKMAGKAFGPDAYGDYNDDAGGKAKEFFNRSLNMKEGIAGLQDTFKRPTKDNITSQLTLGLVGKSEREKDAEKLKKTASMMKTNNAITGNAKFGALANNSIPKFKAPAYGKKGMKFTDPKSKPTNDVLLPSDFPDRDSYDKWYTQKYGRSQFQMPFIGEKNPAGLQPTKRQLGIQPFSNQFKLYASRYETPKQPAPPKVSFGDVMKTAPGQFKEAWSDFTGMFSKKEGGKLKSKSKFNRA